MTDLEQIEVTIDQSQDAINMHESLKKLIKNKDFKRVILDGYIKEEAIRLVQLKADLSMQKPEYQEDIDNRILSIGYLNRYFQFLESIGSQALVSLEDSQNAREEILNGGE